MEEWTFKGTLFLFFCNIVYYAIYKRNFTHEEEKIKKIEVTKKHIYDLYKYDSTIIDRLKQIHEIKNTELNILNNEL